MLKKRVMPCLLLKGESLVKTEQFGKYNYIGDPINAVKIFNDCEVDEIILLDIDASIEDKEPNYDLIRKIVNESFVPMAYGGGVKTVGQMEKLFQIGIEKVSLNTLIFEDEETVIRAVERFGAQSIVASLDVKKNLFGKYEVFYFSAKKKSKHTLLGALDLVQRLGVGEILINDISKDGMMNGYNLDLIKRVVDYVSVPVIGIGGAGQIDDLRKGFETGIKALAAGSLFVYKSNFKGVLINYPNQEIEKMR